MKWTLRIIVLAVVLIVVRTALGFGLAKAHYESTPTFRAWVRGHPVDDEVWQTSIPSGETISTELPWSSEDDGLDAEHGEVSRTWSPHLQMKHGEERLLELELEVVFGATPSDSGETFEGLTISAPTSYVDPDFHGVVVLSIASPPTESARELGMEPKILFPSVRVDAFALSGPGAIEFVVQDWPKRATGAIESALFGEGDFATLNWDWAGRFLLGLPCSFEEPPKEGLVYSLGTTCFGGEGLGSWCFAGSSEQYSIELRGEQEMKKVGGSVSTSAHRYIQWTWQDRTW